MSTERPSTTSSERSARPWRRLASVIAGVVLAGIAVLLLATGTIEVRLRPPEEPSRADAPPESHGPVLEGRVVLDAEAVLASRLEIAPVATATIPVRVQLPGEVELAEGRWAHVTPRIGGAVRELHAAEGDDVEEGAPLATIESVELGEARAGYVAAVSTRRLEERSFHRWRELFERGLRTQNELWTAESLFIRSQLAVESAASRLRALGATEGEIAALHSGGSSAVTNRFVLRSPLRGSVLERRVTLGEYVSPHDQVFLVGDLAEVWVQAAVRQEDLGAVRRGARASVRIHGIEDATFEGEVTYVGLRVDERTRTVPVRVAVKNAPLPGSSEPYGLRPSLFATVDLVTAHREGVIVVPSAAVQTEGGATIVFVATEDREAPGRVAFERRVVVLGGHANGVVEVASGLDAGERVAVRNAHVLSSELKQARQGGSS